MRRTVAWMELQPMRLDRAITLNVIRPIQRILASKDGDRTRAGGECIPILMYHSICDAAESSAHPYYQTSTKLEMYTKQMEHNAENRLQAITLKQAIEWSKVDRRRPSNKNGDFPNALAAVTWPVVLTFDDGYRDFYTDAMTILRKHGFTATMFLSTA